MKVLITGGSGFIGRALVANLASNGHSIRLLTRKLKQYPVKEIEIIEADLTLEQDFSHVVAGCDAVINCAGEIRDVTKMRSLHVDGTGKLLQAFKESAAKEGVKKHWIQLSSVGAYGPVLKSGTPRVVTEETFANPQGEYEVTKTLADELVMSMADKFFTYTILRPSNVVGASMTNQSFAGLLKLIKKRLFFYIGSRESMATYIHVDDVVAALMLCLEHPQAINQIFNVSNDCKLADIVASVAEAQKASASFRCLPESGLRIIAKVMAKMRRWPLTESRIDALVSQTAYPTTKLEKLGFKAKVSIPDFAAEYSKSL